MMPQLLGDLKTSGILLATKSQVFLMQWPWFFRNWGKYAKVQVEEKTNFSNPSLGGVLDPVCGLTFEIFWKNMSRNLRAEKEGLEAYSACHPKGHITPACQFSSHCDWQRDCLSAAVLEEACTHHKQESYSMPWPLPSYSPRDSWGSGVPHNSLSLPASFLTNLQSRSNSSL